MVDSKFTVGGISCRTGLTAAAGSCTRAVQSPRLFAAGRAYHIHELSVAIPTPGFACLHTYEERQSDN